MSDEEVYDPLAHEDARIVRLAERFSKGEIDLAEYEKRLDAILNNDTPDIASEAYVRQMMRMKFDKSAVQYVYSGADLSWPKPTIVWNSTDRAPVIKRRR